MKTIKVGDTVRYSRHFLRNIMALSDPIGQLVGTVVYVEAQPLRAGGPFVCKVRWYGHPGQSGVLSCNLEPSPAL